MALPIFNVSDLRGRFLGHVSAWQELVELCETQRIAYSQARAHDPELVSGDDYLPLNHESPDSYARTLNENIGTGLSVYHRQMFVVVSSLFETTLRHFWACAYFCKPERLNEPLAAAGQTAKIELRDLLAAPDKESLLKKLSIDCARRSSEGKKSATVERIRKLDRKKEFFTDDLCRKLLRITEERNIIVHASHKLPPTADDVREAFSVLGDVLTAFQGLARSLGIPMNENGYCMLWLDEFFYSDLDNDVPGPKYSDLPAEPG